MKKYLAEMIGTLVLVLMGCGSTVMIGGCNSVIQIILVAFCFGLSVIAMTYAIGGISGCHINPAITLGVWLSGRMSGKDAGMYVLFQVIGAFIGSIILYTLVNSIDANYVTTTGANILQNGVTWYGAFIAETVFTFILVLVVLGATDAKLGGGNVAGLAIGLTLTLIHMVCIPIDGTGVNPARSIAPAVFEGGAALQQLWIFIIAPTCGGAIAAGVWKVFDTSKDITK